MKELPKLIALTMVLFLVMSASVNAESRESETEGSIAEPDEMMQIEVLQNVLVFAERTKMEKPVCHRFFNKRFQLVYMCKEVDDERLRELMRRSDIIWTTHSSSYYLLGD